MQDCTMVTLMTSTTTLLEEKMSKYELGTVALATYIDGSGSEIALRNVSGWTGTRGSISRSAEKAFTFRPLVVIDPEDREQVERFVHSLPLDWNLEQPDDPDLFHESVDQVRAALRKFANPRPPKPEEPTGLGAVVEDADGVRYVRSGLTHGGRMVDHWRVASGPNVGHWYRWQAVPAVKVLSEGVNL